MELSRRGLITGLVAFAAAPAIVRAENLMPVKKFEQQVLRIIFPYDFVVKDRFDMVYKYQYIRPQWLEFFEKFGQIAASPMNSNE